MKIVSLMAGVAVVEPFGDFSEGVEYRRIEVVGPSVGSELIRAGM